MSADLLDDELANEFNKGSKEAFTAIYKLLYHPVFVSAKEYVNAAEAEDITATTFAKLWERHGRFKTFLNIRAFLFVTARNACLDYLKHQNVKARKQTEISQLSDQEEKIVFRDEIESDLMRWMKIQIPILLPPQEAKIIELAYYGDYKNPEIAQILEIEEKTVRNLRSSALKKLRFAFFNRTFKNGLIVLTAIALSAFAGLIIFC